MYRNVFFLIFFGCVIASTVLTAESLPTAGEIRTLREVALRESDEFSPEFKKEIEGYFEFLEKNPRVAISKSPSSCGNAAKIQYVLQFLYQNRTAFEKSDFWVAFDPLPLISSYFGSIPKEKAQQIDVVILNAWFDQLKLLRQEEPEVFSKFASDILLGLTSSFETYYLQKQELTKLNEMADLSVTLLGNILNGDNRTWLLGFLERRAKNNFRLDGTTGDVLEAWQNKARNNYSRLRIHQFYKQALENADFRKQRTGAILVEIQASILEIKKQNLKIVDAKINNLFLKEIESFITPQYLSKALTTPPKSTKVFELIQTGKDTNASGLVLKQLDILIFELPLSKETESSKGQFEKLKNINRSLTMLSYLESSMTEAEQVSSRETIDYMFYDLWNSVFSQLK